MTLDVRTEASLTQWPELPELPLAACKDSFEAAVFFPPSGGGAIPSESRAKTICGCCPAREACLAFALEHREPHGVWGGMTAKERRQLLRGEAS